jgi:hypothetical protein
MGFGNRLSGKRSAVNLASIRAGSPAYFSAFK